MTDVRLQGSPVKLTERNGQFPSTRGLGPLISLGIDLDRPSSPMEAFDNIVTLCPSMVGFLKTRATQPVSTSQWKRFTR